MNKTSGRVIFSTIPRVCITGDVVTVADCQLATRWRRMSGHVTGVATRVARK
jgi:hypothetical protein